MQVQGMTLVIPFYQVVGVYILFWFPHVVRRWIAFPFDQVLKVTPTSVMSVIEDGLNFVFLRAFDQVWWWLLEIGTMSSCLFIWQQEGCVKNVMDPPRQGECELIGYQGDYFADAKWSLSSGG